VDPNKINKIKLIRRPDREFSIQNNAFCFLPGDRRPENTAGNGLLSRIQEFFKKFGKLYYGLMIFFAPVIESPKYKKKLKSLLNKHDKTATIINLGSGPTYLFGRTDVINIDIFAFDEIDIIADANDLPIKDNSVDLIINTAMLEHVADPEIIIREMHRILKKDGGFFCFLPFMQPFHAAPYDFHRWTIEGAKKYFLLFQDIQTGIGAGPTSGMLWIVLEWLAILFSFGSRTMHDIVFLFLMVVTVPIKLLDIVLVHFPHAEKIASGFIVTGRK
jgi:SAM-dependent methyltransferase